MLRRAGPILSLQQEGACLPCCSMPFSRTNVLWSADHPHTCHLLLVVSFDASITYSFPYLLSNILRRAWISGTSLRAVRGRGKGRGRPWSQGQRRGSEDIRIFGSGPALLRPPC